MTIPFDSTCVFDRFVTGSENRVAAAAALRAAESPGRSYNPLVISGPSGTGKTHLLMAIGQRARVLDPELVIHYESGEALVDRVTTGISAGSLDAFHQASTGIDLLLLDGLEEVAGKGRTQEELSRLAGELVSRGAQVVVAAAAPLGEIPGLDAELVSRLGGGLNVEIGAPEEATRRGILTRIAAEHGFGLSGELLTAMAELPIRDVRELRIAMDRLVAAAELESRAVTVDDVAQLAGASLPSEPIKADEFDLFLSDISTAVAAVVETAPWRRRLAAAILRWEGEGIRTRRLEAALDADSAPDVEALLTAFGRDVGRLRHIARELPNGAAADPLLFRDPDRLQEAERLLAESAASRPVHQPAPATAGSLALPPQTIDRWFLDREKLAWDWLALDDRMVEEQR